MEELKLVRQPSYYNDILDKIAKLGYLSPDLDHEDPRQKLIWQQILLGGWSLEVIEKYNCQSLAKRTDPLYPRFQTRADCESDVDQFYEDFYEHDIRQDRIIFGMRIGGKVFITVGNKRIRAHEKAIKQGKESKCDVVIIDCGNIDLSSKLKIANELARGGNKKRHDTRPESEADYTHQLNQAFEIECMQDSLKKDWTESEKIDWGKKWVIEKIDTKYSHDCMKKRLGDIVNHAFAEHRGQSLPFPDTDTIANKFKGFFPNNSWDEANPKIIMRTMSTHLQSLKSQLLRPWSDREEFSKVRKKCWLTLRCGHKKDSDITSLGTVTKNRTSTLEELRKWNANKNHEGAGFPVVERIMFVRQMNLDSYEAHEWNDETDEFNEL